MCMVREVAASFLRSLQTAWSDVLQEALVDHAVPLSSNCFRCMVVEGQPVVFVCVVVGTVALPQGDQAAASHRRWTVVPALPEG